MEGSLHERTLVKAARARAEGWLGYITRAILGRCIRGRSTVRNASLPWHVRYSSFNGTLLKISRIDLTVLGRQWNTIEPIFGIECLLSGGTFTLGIARDVTAVAGQSVWGGSSPSSCGIKVTISATSNSLTVAGVATRISVPLI
jgi:hypothetical protein